MEQQDPNPISTAHLRFEMICRDAAELAASSRHLEDLAVLFKRAGLYPTAEDPFSQELMGDISNQIADQCNGTTSHRTTALNALRAFARVAEKQYDESMYEDARVLLRREGIRGRVSSLVLGFLNPFVNREMIP